jgi:hypothetical protein
MTIFVYVALLKKLAKVFLYTTFFTLYHNWKHLKLHFGSSVYNQWTMILISIITPVYQISVKFPSILTFRLTQLFDMFQLISDQNIVNNEPVLITTDPKDWHAVKILDREQILAKNFLINLCCYIFKTVQILSISSSGVFCSH